jgi:hypothetical protein
MLSFCLESSPFVFYHAYIETRLYLFSSFFYLRFALSLGGCLACHGRLAAQLFRRRHHFASLPTDKRRKIKASEQPIEGFANSWLAIDTFAMKQVVAEAGDMARCKVNANTK